MLIDIHTHHFREKSEGVLSLVQDKESVGIHPWDVGKIDMNNVEIVCNEYVMAIGECGIDKLCTVPVEKQLACFRKHICVSEEMHLPLIIHCVKAQEELLRIRKELHPVQPWIWHGFRGKPLQLTQLIQAGLWISFGMNYNRESLLLCPLHRMLLETDDAEVSIEDVYERVSKDMCISVEQLERVIENNFAKIKEVR